MYLQPEHKVPTIVFLLHSLILCTDIENNRNLGK